jgi:hypothetical protein
VTHGTGRAVWGAYFLGATLAGALLIRAGLAKDRLLAVAAPGLGLAAWFLQDNAYGLVVAYGFVLGALVAAALPAPRPALRRHAAAIPKDCESSAPNRCAMLYPLSYGRLGPRWQLANQYDFSWPSTCCATKLRIISLLTGAIRPARTAPSKVATP